MVSAPATIEWSSFSVRVNGLEFQQVCLRPCVEQPTLLDVVIRDRLLGSFALHEEFVLELPRGKEDERSWCRVSLQELKGAIGKCGQVTDTNFGVLIGLGSSPSQDLQRAPRCRIDRIPVEGDSSHLDRLRECLLTARIHYQIVGGLDNRGRSAGHLTVAVNSSLGAVRCLQRAGFFASPESKCIVIDSRTGWKVRLLEGSPGPSR